MASTETNIIAVEDVADMVLRLGGPYSPEAVTAATELVGELVRRLNHATFGAQAFRYPSDAHRVIGNLAGAVYGLPQLLGQLREQLRRFGGHPGLYDDRPAEDGPITLDYARRALEIAAGDAEALGEVLGRARSHTSHLGIRD